MSNMIIDGNIFDQNMLWNCDRIGDDDFNNNSL